MLRGEDFEEEKLLRLEPGDAYERQAPCHRPLMTFPWYAAKVSIR